MAYRVLRVVLSEAEFETLQSWAHARGEHVRTKAAKVIANALHTYRPDELARAKAKQRHKERVG